MTLSGRPLLDTRRDAGLFVDRERERSRILDASKRGLNCLVLGDRGMGKTSLLRTMLGDVRLHHTGDEIVARYVRGAGASTAAELLTRVIAAVAPAARQDANNKSAPADPIDPAQLLDQLDQAVESLRDERHHPNRVTILLDDPPPSAAHTLFGTLRDELWEHPVRWVVAVDTEQAGDLLRPPADAFFETTVTLSPLTPDAAADLLRRRDPKLGPDLVDTAVWAGEGNARRVLEVVRALVSGEVDPQEMMTAYGHRDQALAALGRSALALAKELEARGGSSASDEHLLRRMGWTRGRAAQVLGELEAAGLVVADELREGPGRPRKLYRLRPALDYLRASTGRA